MVATFAHYYKTFATHFLKPVGQFKPVMHSTLMYRPTRSEFPLLQSSRCCPGRSVILRLLGILQLCAKQCYKMNARQVFSAILTLEHLRRERIHNDKLFFLTAY